MNKKRLLGMLLLMVVQSLVSSTKGPLSVYLFLHGTVGSIFLLSSIHKIFKDQLKGSWFEANTARLRDSNWFGKNQIMLQQGLTEINLDSWSQPDTQEAHAEGAFPIVQAFCEFRKAAYSNVQQGAPEEALRFYAFGWSGLLSYRGRIRAAFEEYLALQRLIMQLEQEGWGPINIHEIAHSHGGNVALHKMQVHYYRQWLQKGYGDNAEGLFDPAFGQVAQEFASQFLPDIQKDRPWVKIKDLWLLGTPIQVETANLARKELFESVFNICSKGDRIQVWDFFSTAGRRSERILPCGSGDEHVVQCELELARAWKKKRSSKRSFRTVRPTHKDLWFLSSGRHRLNFMQPLPLVTIMPLVGVLCREIDNNVWRANPSRLVSLEVANANDLLTLTLKDKSNLQVLAKRSIPLEVMRLNQAQATQYYSNINNFVSRHCSRWVRALWRFYSICNL